MTSNTPNVALVGGTPNVSTFREHLEGWGVDVCAHIPYLPLRVPKQATHVVVLKTHCSHNLYHAAQKVAGRRHLSLCAVEQAWSQAEPLLRQHGVIPTLAQQGQANHQANHQANENPRDRILTELQAKVVRLEDLLGQAEEMILERDELVCRLSEQMRLVLSKVQGFEKAAPREQEPDEDLVDPWEGLVRPWLSQRNGSPFTIRQCVYAVFGIPPLDQGRGYHNRIAVALRKLGYDKRKARRGEMPDGSRPWLWFLVA